MGLEKYISKVDGKFSVDRIFNDKKYNFGIFNTYDEALDKLEYLEEEGWPISLNDDDNSVQKGSSKTLNNIEEVNGKFVVFKYICDEKIIFGEFDSVDEAIKIRDNLIANAWESMEENDRSKYAKYIRANRGKFIVNKVYNNVLHTFGYFDTFEEALECREDLIANNWGELNIPLTRRCGKFISFNGIMYTIQKTVDDEVNVFGYFYNLDDAVRQRDWLVANNWSKLEVPDDSKRHIHKQGDKFLIYKRLENDLEYFGTFQSLEEAKEARNNLVENDWIVKDEINDLEKITDFVYFDGEFYTIRRVVDDQTRIYGVYKNKNQAISDEKSLINYVWDSVYTVPTPEYPYGDHIVPFDYIFILEEVDAGINNEIGRYYSFKDAVMARNEYFDLNNDVDELTFSVKIGKSYKNRGWSIIRDSTYELIPKLPYEDDCDIIVDGIPVKAKLNLLPRIFYNRTDDVVDHLENLAKTDPNGRIDVKLLLNKKSTLDDSKTEIKDLNNKLKEVYSINHSLESDIHELKEILNYMDDENKEYHKKFNSINKILEELDAIEFDLNEVSSISDPIFRIKLFDVVDQINALKKLF